MLYFVTTTIHFADPDNKYLDTEEDNIVCGVYRTKTEAKKRMIELATSTLFYGCENHIKETENTVTIFVPDYVDAKWNIREYPTT